MDLVFDQRSANSPFVEMFWHTHSERAGTFTSVAASKWEMPRKSLRNRRLNSLRLSRTLAFCRATIEV